MPRSALDAPIGPILEYASDLRGYLANIAVLREELAAIGVDVAAVEASLAHAVEAGWAAKAAHGAAFDQVRVAQEQRREVAARIGQWGKVQRAWLRYVERQSDSSREVVLHIRRQLKPAQRTFEGGLADLRRVVPVFRARWAEVAPTVPETLTRAEALLVEAEGVDSVVGRLEVERDRRRNDVAAARSEIVAIVRTVRDAWQLAAARNPLVPAFPRLRHSVDA